MSALAKLPTQWPVARLNALARRGRVPTIPLSHLAVRVLLFFLGQRPGYFAHQQVIADAVESNLTSVRRALTELRGAGLVSWDLIPPHHPLPTGKYSRTNVNQYFVEADALLSALRGDDDSGAPSTVASTHPNSAASTCTDPKFEQDPPLSPDGHKKRLADEQSPEGWAFASKVQKRERRGATTRTATTAKYAEELEPVLTAWRGLNLGEPDDRFARALINRLAEGANIEQLRAAVEGASANDWLRAGRAKVPFAIVFASRRSVERFAAEGLERGEQARLLVQQRAGEQRRAREALSMPKALSRPEYTELATRALRACE